MKAPSSIGVKWQDANAGTRTENCIKKLCVRSARRVCASPARVKRRLKAFSQISGSGGESRKPQSYITSTANDLVKYCCKLRDSGAFRAQQNSVLVVGSTTVEELAAEVEGLLLKALIWREGKYEPPAWLQTDRTCIVTEPVIQKIAGIRSAEGVTVVAVLEVPPNANADLTINAGTHIDRLLVLDGIQDPGNLGTLLRTALALGWAAAFLLPGCCDPFNAKALRASRGAAFKIKWSVGEWDTLEQVLSKNGMQVFAAQALQETGSQPKDQPKEASDARLLASIRDSRIALILGNEGQGLSDISRRRGKPVAIPMNAMESLSVSQAGAILLFELSKSSLRF